MTPLCPDKDQECDISETRPEAEVGANGEQVDGGLGKVRSHLQSSIFVLESPSRSSSVPQVMSTIKGVGNKSLQHTNSVTGLPSASQLPKYGVVTTHEEELGLQLGDLARWGINVFKISELSNSRPLTAVTYTVFHVRRRGRRWRKRRKRERRSRRKSEGGGE